MDVYYEQTVENHNIDDCLRRTKTLNVVRMICFVLAMFIMVSCIMTPAYFWIFIIFAVPFFITALILGRLNKRWNTEYDYVLDDEFLRISEIYFRNRRKLKFRIKLTNVESIGMFGSNGYKKAEQSAGKKFLALVNYDDEDSILYVLYNSDKGRQIVFIEPDRGFVMTLRRVIRSAPAVFDVSLKDFEKRLSQKEEIEAIKKIEEPDVPEEQAAYAPEPDVEQVSEAVDEALEDSENNMDESGGEE